MLIANHVISSAKTPDDLMLGLARHYTDDPQINAMRTPTPLINTRTTEQLMLEPGKQMMMVRNTDGVLDFTQEDANPPGSRVLVGII